MKRVIAILITSILTFSLAACQKTPESPIVVGKDLENMVDKAAKEPIVAATDSGDGLLTPLEAPEKLTLEAKGKKGNLSIHIDADVVVPDSAGMPVARVTRGRFSEDDVKNLYEALCGDAKSIHPDSSPQSAYYLQKVQELREIKKTENYDDKTTAETIDGQIEEWMEQAANAPESYEYVEPDFSFKENKDETKWPVGFYSHLCFTPDDKTVSEIYVIQDSQGTGASAEYIRDKYSDDSEGQGDLPAISQDEAQKLARDTITKLGLSDFVCTGKRINTISELPFSSNPVCGNRNLYEFMFTRTINNAPITYTDDDGLTTIHDAYFKPWMYEKVRILIDDKGVFGLTWNSPYVVKEIESDASSMLSFSDVQDVLIKMLPIKYDHMDGDETYSYEMKITEVRLGLMRITEKNVGESGLVIPVWDVFGSLALKGKPGRPNPEEGEKNYDYDSFITINAIDGSIIDRDLGY